MKVSNSSILSLVLALNGVMASPLQARDYAVVTVTELTTRYIHVTSTTWVDSAQYTPTAVPTTTTDPDEKKKKKNDTTSTPSVSISETLATPTVSSSISELSVVPSSTLAYSSVETTQQTTLSTTSTSSSTSKTSSTSSTPTPTSSSSSTTTSSSTTSSTTKYIPTTKSELPTSTLTPSTTSISVPTTTPAPPTTLETSTLPVPTTPISTPPVVKVEPTTTTPAPVPSAPVGKTTSDSNTGSTPSTSHVGDATFYDTGMGSCGIVSQDSSFIAAISHLLMDSKKTADPNKNPFCGTTILCSYKGGPEIPVVIVDRCTGCAQWDLDLSPAAYQAIGAKTDDGRVSISWRFP